MNINNEFPEMQIKEKVIIYSVRGQILSKLASILIIYIFSFITTFITLYLLNKGNFTLKENIIPMEIVFILSTMFSFLFVTGPKEMSFFNPNWIIKSPKPVEIKYFIYKRRKELEELIKSKETIIIEMKEDKEELQKELFSIKQFTMENINLW